MLVSNTFIRCTEHILALALEALLTAG